MGFLNFARSIVSGRDFTPVNKAVAELEAAMRQTPEGASLRVPVRGTEVSEVMAVAVRKLLEKHPSRLRAVKWQRQDGLETSPGAEDSAWVTIMRTPDLFANFDKEWRDQMESQRQVIGAETAGDLDPDLAFDPNPARPEIKIIVDKDGKEPV